MDHDASIERDTQHLRKLPQWCRVWPSVATLNRRTITVRRAAANLPILWPCNCNGLSVEVHMEVTVEYLGAAQFEVRARNHKIACDQPEENGGFDEGMTPPELLLASLGTCAGYYAAEYLRTRQLPTAGMRVRVTA